MKSSKHQEEGKITRKIIDEKLREQFNNALNCIRGRETLYKSRYKEHLDSIKKHTSSEISRLTKMYHAKQKYLGALVDLLNKNNCQFLLNQDNFQYLAGIKHPDLQQKLLAIMQDNENAANVAAGIQGLIARESFSEFTLSIILNNPENAFWLGYTLGLLSEYVDLQALEKENPGILKFIAEHEEEMHLFILRIKEPVHLEGVRDSLREVFEKEVYVPKQDIIQSKPLKDKYHRANPTRHDTLPRENKNTLFQSDSNKSQDNAAKLKKYHSELPTENKKEEEKINERKLRKSRSSAA